MTLLFPRLDSTGLFVLWFVKDIVYCEEVQNVNELCDKIIRAAECITNEMLASTW
jgi:hypothetical protein